MGLGAFSNIIQGKTGNPWLAGLGLLAFNSLYITRRLVLLQPAGCATPATRCTHWGC